MVDLKGRSILVVDDETMLREVIVDVFRKAGCQVRETDGGHAALKIIQEHTIDLVISDIRMPKGDGIELLKRKSELQGKRPIFIMMTGFSDLTEEKAIKMGAAALIYKPFSKDHLFKTIKSVIEAKGEAVGL
jgi:DNA-binding NtrC family response regulator